MHPHGNRLAVEQTVAEPGCRLQRVTDGVPVVEHRTVARLAFVARDDRRLDGAGLANRAGQRITVAPEESIKAAVEVGDE